MLEEVDCVGKFLQSSGFLPVFSLSLGLHLLRAARQPGNHWHYWEWRVEALKPPESKSQQHHLYRAFLSNSPLFAQPHAQKIQGLEEGPPPDFSDFMRRPQTFTLFFWQESQWLHEDQAESRQSRGCGEMLTDRTRLPLATLLLLRLRVSFSPLHSTTQVLHHVKWPSGKDRATWFVTIKNYTPTRPNAF